MNDSITIYGTTWCGGTRRARRIFDDNKIPYKWVDIDDDHDARDFVEKTNNGYRSVPTILFSDGSTLTEPSDEVLAARLGVPKPKSFF